MQTVLSVSRKIAALSLVMLFMAGCTPTVTLAETATAILTSVDAVLAITNPSYDETELNSAANTAIAALEAWKPGTDSTQVIQSLNAFESVVKTITQIPAKYQDVIAVAVTGIESIVAVVQAGSSTTATTASAASPKVYKASFNAAVAKHPELGQAKF